jgi:hypothetical protein
MNWYVVDTFLIRFSANLYFFLCGSTIQEGCLHLIQFNVLQKPEAHLNVILLKCSLYGHTLILRFWCRSKKKLKKIILNSPSVNILNFYVRVISLLPFFKLMTFLKKKFNFNMYDVMCLVICLSSKIVVPISPLYCQCGIWLCFIYTSFLSPSVTI